MSKVDLIATKDFSYATRRLKAGDPFQVDERMAKVLVAIGKARAYREPGTLPRPPQRLLTKVVGEKPKRRARKFPAKKG